MVRGYKSNLFIPVHTLSTLSSHPVHTTLLTPSPHSLHSHSHTLQPSLFQVFTIEVVRGYKSDLFREDLKKVYDLAGLQQLNTVFLFNDTQAHFYYT